MGIPRFYRWLRNRYPQIRMDLSDTNKQIPVIDNLYIDFNGLIYQCLRDSECFLKNKFAPLSIEEIYDRTEAYMLKIIQKVNPQHLLFIGFDGVAPRAKINQSRDRRFRAAKQKQDFYELLEKLGLKDHQNFQENSISPGTEFLTNFCERLKRSVMNRVESEWRHLKVLFSDCSVPGEGEHKIMNFLRSSKQLNIFGPTATHCIYSADADVILLSLALNIPNICLIREDSMKLSFGFTAATNIRKYKEPLFQYVFLNILREYFSKQFEECLKQLKSNDITPIINDFILLMAFVGNDFLPVEFCFSLKQTHMENLFNSYKSYLMENKTFINNEGIIDWGCIEKLLQVAKQFEAAMLDEKIKNKRSQKVMKQSLQQIEEDEKENDDEIEKFEVVEKKVTKGREFYYLSRFGITDVKTDPKFEQIILKYIEGLDFYARYYFRGLPSWSWYYSYHYTPLLVDVYQYIVTHKINIQLNQGQPYDPFLALMFMLPEQSFSLLPKQINEALRDKNCPLRSPIDYFPHQFELDKYQQLSYHKRALIPFLNENQVREVYQKFQRNSYSAKQKDRNVKNNTLLIEYVNGRVSAIQVVFGNQQSIKQFVSGKWFLSNSERARFPTLGIFGNFTLDSNGRIHVERKYKYEGSPNEMAFFNNFLGYIQDMNQCIGEMKGQIEAIYNGSGIIGNCINYYRVKRVTRIREINRNSFIKTNREVIVPDFALFKIPKYSYIPQVENIEQKNQYEIGEKVVLLSEKYFGYAGTIQALNAKTAQVKIVDNSYTTNHKIEENEEQFFTLEYIAKQCGVHPTVLLTILDEFLILPKTKRNNKKKENTDIYPTAFNFGLSVISARNGLLLPHYARCQMEFENSENTEEIFEKVELSKSCWSAIDKYIEAFPWIIDYIENCISERDFSFKKEAYARILFKEEKDPNMKLYKQFLKLYDVGVNGYFYSIYSKVANKDNLPNINPTQRIKQTIEVPYYEIISKRLAQISPPPLKSQPEFPDIGDRVIILKSFQVGYIIGIDDDRLIVKLGKTKQPRRVGFLDVFNSKWIGNLQKQEGKCWSMQISYYSPSHYVKAIQK